MSFRYLRQPIGTIYSQNMHMVFPAECIVPLLQFLYLHAPQSVDFLLFWRPDKVGDMLCSGSIWFSSHALTKILQCFLNFPFDMKHKLGQLLVMCIPHSFIEGYSRKRSSNCNGDCEHGLPFISSLAQHQTTILHYSWN